MSLFFLVLKYMVYLHIVLSDVEKYRGYIEKFVLMEIKN
jgi:hypothetical protein